MNPKLYLHFGAGNIGRALAGPIFSRAGYRLVFVDAMPEVVAAMRQRGNYRVVVKDTLPPGAPDSFTVSDVDALDVRDADAVGAAIAQADLIGTAVGAAYLPDVLRSIAQALHFAATDPAGQPYPPDTAFLEQIAQLGLEAVLARHCALTRPQDSPAIALISTRYREIAAHG